VNREQLRDGDFFDVTGQVFKYIKESWEAFKLNWPVFVGAIVAIFGVAIIGSLVATALFGTTLVTTGDQLTTSSFTSVLAVTAFTVLAVSLLVIVIAPLVITAQLASARNKKHSFGEFFAQSKSKILGFLGLSILSGLAVTLGLIFLIIPGLVIAFFLSFAPYIYLDKKIGTVDAMKASYELVKEFWKVTAALVIVQIAISLVGRLTFIGAIASIALTIAYFCIGAIVYVKISSKATATVEAKVQEKTKKA
jgi:uncharacterized membrane protein